VKGRKEIEWVINKIDDEVKEIERNEVKSNDEILKKKKKYIDEIKKKEIKYMDDI
jgi:hypothetical protein